MRTMSRALTTPPFETLEVCFVRAIFCSQGRRGVESSAEAGGWQAFRFEKPTCKNLFPDAERKIKDPVTPYSRPYSSRPRHMQFTTKPLIILLQQEDKLQPVWVSLRCCSSS